jgi:hypothetical protein
MTTLPDDEPTAQQSEAFAQETPSRAETPLGTACGFQVLPPLVLLATDPKSESPAMPTVQQRDVLGQARLVGRIGKA